MSDAPPCCIASTAPNASGESRRKYIAYSGSTAATISVDASVSRLVMPRIQTLRRKRGGTCVSASASSESDGLADRYILRPREPCPILPSRDKIDT